MNSERSKILVLLMLLFCPSTLAKAETFTFGIGDWPPFISETAPGFGPHAEKVARAFRKAGHEIRLEFLPWRRSFEMSRHGTIPATFSWAFTKERTRDFLYPALPIDQARDVYFYRKDRFPDGLSPLSFEDLSESGLTVVGVSDYWYDAPLAEAGVSLQRVATEEQAWSMLLHGRADLYIENDAVGKAHSRNFLGTQAAEIANSRPIRIVPLYILFSKHNPDARRMMEIWDRFGGREEISATSYDFR